MSRIQIWNQMDDRNNDKNFITWVGRVSEEALLEGDDFLLADILRGASNFFYLRGLAGTQAIEVDGNAVIVEDWLWGIYSDIYIGTSDTDNQDIEYLSKHRSVIDCLRLLNSFIDLNDLRAVGQKVGDSLNLIIPES